MAAPDPVTPVVHETHFPETSLTEAQVVTRVTPIHERTFEVECTSCKVCIKFQVQHVFRTYVTTWAWLWGTPDGFDVKCPYCSTQVSVRKCLPTWIAKRI